MEDETVQEKFLLASLHLAVQINKKRKHTKEEDEFLKRLDDVMELLKSE